MRISKREDFSLILMNVLAKKYSKDYIPLSEVATSTKLSPLFLKHIANRLKIKGLIESKEGMSGGYRLSREPEKITVTDILQSVGSELILPSCYSGDCRLKKDKCQVFAFWSMVNKKLFSFLKNITLADYSRI